MSVSAKAGLDGVVAEEVVALAFQIADRLDAFGERLGGVAPRKPADEPFDHVAEDRGHLGDPIGHLARMSRKESVSASGRIMATS